MPPLIAFIVGLVCGVILCGVLQWLMSGEGHDIIKTRAEMIQQQSDKDRRHYGSAFEFWWDGTTGKDLPAQFKEIAWEAWKASAARPNEFGMPDYNDPNLTAAAPGVLWGPPEQLSMGTWIRRGSSTGAVLPECGTSEADLKKVLQDACDRDWKDETLWQTANIAANAIYWRGREIEELKEKLNIANDGLAVSADIIRQYQSAPRSGCGKPSPLEDFKTIREEEIAEFNGGMDAFLEGVAYSDLPDVPNDQNGVGWAWAWFLKNRPDLAVRSAIGKPCRYPECQGEPRCESLGTPKTPHPLIEPCDGCEHATPVRSTSGKLDKPAMVGNTRFGVGIDWRTVIERAQREYEYQVTPEKEALRMKRVGAFVNALSEPTPATMMCETCGADRFKEPCKKPSGCTMYGTPFSANGQRTDG